MQIAEIYHSIQGEGELTGTPSTFVRASGCNLRCGFCDTPYTSWEPEGDDVSVTQIVATVQRLEASHVVITGGEPMLFAELIPLCEQLRADGRHITIETAGTLYLPVVCDLMSISPKMSNSTPAAERAPQWRERHERTRQAPLVLHRLTEEYRYQLKYVVSTPQDAAEVDEHLLHFPNIPPQRVWLMPEGTQLETLAGRAEWLEEYAQHKGYNFCPRMQIEWFGSQRGT